ncbi:MAG: VWA domain-containing protein, partial [Thermoanaerobaculia bacterium]|nr:VWA domain-containing protein [Thermoanaerobaculia bacterium]
ATATAAQPTGGAGFAGSVDARLVEVDVVVTGDDGRPVTDLPRAAFRLFEDGREVEISHFAPPASARAGGRNDGPAAAAAGAGAPRREPLLVAVFVDDLAVGVGSREPLFAALFDALLARLAPDDRVALARFDRSFVELLPPTADRRALRRAIETLEPLSPARVLAEQELRTALELIRVDAQEGPCLHGEEIARGYADAAARDVRASAAALSSYVGSLVGLPGRKSVVYVSDGPAFTPGLEALEYAVHLCDGTAAAQGVPGTMDATAELQDGAGGRFDPKKVRLTFAEYSTEELWRQVVGHANAVGVTLYAAQAGTRGRHAMADVGDASVAPNALATTIEQNRGVVLPLVAEQTGGRALGRGADAGELVGGLIEDLDARYTLAFAPGERGRVGLRSLRVEVDRPGLRLRFRQSYLLRRAQDEVEEQLLAFLLRGEGANALAVALAPLPRERGAAAKLRLEVPLARVTLLDAGDGSRRGHLMAYLALRDGRGRILPIRQRGFEIHVPAGGPAAGESYRFDVELPSDDDGREIAVGVFDLFSGETAFARATLR